MHNLYVNELKSKYSAQIITRAVRGWKKLKLTDEEMAMKIDAICERLTTASKLEFIAIFNSYMKR